MRTPAAPRADRFRPVPETQRFLHERGAASDITTAVPTGPDSPSRVAATPTGGSPRVSTTTTSHHVPCRLRSSCPPVSWHGAFRRAAAGGILSWLVFAPLLALLFLWAPAGAGTESLDGARPSIVPRATAAHDHPDTPPGGGAESSGLPGLPRAFGPLPRRIVHPFNLPFYRPPAERAHTLPAGRLGGEIISQYSSVQRESARGTDVAIYDGEFLRLSLLLRYGLLEDLEISTELPFLTSGPGFLDDVIRGFHQSTGLLEDSRRQFRYREVLVIDRDRVLDEDPRTMALGDIPVQLKYRILEDGADLFGLALRGGIEIPTGSESAWVGNGGVDGAVGFLVEKSFLDLSLYLNADYRVLSTPRQIEGTRLDVTSAPSFAAALEWRCAQNVSLLGQLDMAPRFVENSDLRLLEGPQVEVSLALRFRTGDRVHWFLGMAEDIVHVTAPDVSFFLGMGFELDVGGGWRSERGAGAAR